MSARVMSGYWRCRCPWRLAEPDAEARVGDPIGLPALEPAGAERPTRGTYPEIREALGLADQVAGGGYARPGCRTHRPERRLPRPFTRWRQTLWPMQSLGRNPALPATTPARARIAARLGGRLVGVAQLVELRVVVPAAAGSSPVAHPCKPLQRRFCGRPDSVLRDGDRLGTVSRATTAGTTADEERDEPPLRLRGDEADLFAAHSEELIEKLARCVRASSAAIEACAFAWVQFLRYQPDRDQEWQGWLFRTAQPRVWRLTADAASRSRSSGRPSRGREQPLQVADSRDRHEERLKFEAAIEELRHLPPRLRQIVMLKVLYGSRASCAVARREHVASRDPDARRSRYTSTSVRSAALRRSGPLRRRGPRGCASSRSFRLSG